MAFLVAPPNEVSGKTDHSAVAAPMNDIGFRPWGLSFLASPPDAGAAGGGPGGGDGSADNFYGAAG